ncbi:MAG: S-adenosylmethionine:tRNA ribosyltransferase-isomerase, partial [Haliscomenobacter sp.]
MTPGSSHTSENTHPRDIHIQEYRYDLPDERIARFPLPERDAARLLVYRQGHIRESVFRELPDLLPPGALLLFNDT